MDRDKLTRHYLEVRGCKSKRTYMNRKDAKEVAKVMNRKNGEGRIRVYCCEFCGHYHIGHIRPSYQDRMETKRIANVLRNAI